MKAVAFEIKVGEPKPFIDISGRPMVEHVIDNVLPINGTVTLLLRQEHIDAQAELTKRLECVVSI